MQPKPRVQLTYEQLVDQYTKDLRERAPKPLTEHTVGYMRACAPNQRILSALNDALARVGYDK